MPSNLEPYISKCDITEYSLYLLSEGKRKARLLGSLSKVLVFKGDVTNGKGIARDKPLHGSRAILDGECSTIRLVGQRSSGVIFRVEKACNRGALGARNPEITGPTVILAN